VHGRNTKWLFGVLVAAGVCGASAVTWAQQVLPVQYRGAPSYAPASVPVHTAGAPAYPHLAANPAVRLAAKPAAAAPVAEVAATRVFADPGVDETDLAAQVAELRAEVQKMKDAQAKAEEKDPSKPSVTFGGRIMADAATFTQNGASLAQAGNFNNGMEIRRTRVYLKGEAFYVVDYKLQFELASRTSIPDFPGVGQSFGVGQVGFKDVYITIKELPYLRNVRIGHFKTPFGLENLTSHRFATFMERAMISEGEIEGRRMGIMAFDHSESERSTWAVALVASQIPENPPIFKNDNGGLAGIARYSFLPWYDEAVEGRGLLHLAVSGSYADIAKGNAVRFDERPESHLASLIIDTGELLDVEAITAMGTELALVYGPFSAQSEFVSFWVDRMEHASPNFQGAYFYLSYFLTGENRQYKRSSGTFDRIHPFENFFRVRTGDGTIQMGKGAWEVGYRYSYFDLNSAGVNGGWAGNHTFGVNWYLNPHCRMMWNYVHSEARDHPDAPGTGQADIFQMRCQFDF